jgi:hypothetical protein
MQGGPLRAYSLHRTHGANRVTRVGNKQPRPTGGGTLARGRQVPTGGPAPATPAFEKNCCGLSAQLVVVLSEEPTEEGFPHRLSTVSSCVRWDHQYTDNGRAHAVKVLLMGTPTESGRNIQDTTSPARQSPRFSSLSPPTWGATRTTGRPFDVRCIRWGRQPKLGPTTISRVPPGSSL